MRKLLTHAGQTYLALLVLVLLTWGITLIYPDTLSIPNTFVSGTTISSSQMNANFSAISSVVNGTLNDVNLKNAGITGSTKLIDGTVTLAKMAGDSVNAAKIVDGSVGTVELADNAVTGPKIGTTRYVTNHAVDDETRAGTTFNYASGYIEVGSVTFTTDVSSAEVVMQATIQASCDAASISNRQIGMKGEYNCGSPSDITPVFTHILVGVGGIESIGYQATSVLHTDNTSCTFRVLIADLVNDGDDCTLDDSKFNVVEYSQ